MDSWMGPGIEPAVDARASILRHLSLCSVTTTDVDGALRTRTALVEPVPGAGEALTVRLVANEVERELVANPRVIVSAIYQADSPVFLVVNGLARITSVIAAGSQQLVLLDVAVQRMEYWTTPTMVRLVDFGRKLFKQGREVLQAPQRELAAGHS
jgi:hypothetical protein